VRFAVPQQGRLNIRLLSDRSRSRGASYGEIAGRVNAVRGRPGIGELVISLQVRVGAFTRTEDVSFNNLIWELRYPGKC
jgi:hypothetical protein